MQEESSTTKKPTIAEVRIQVDYYGDKHGRWSKTFHISQGNGSELVLSQREAVKLAKSLLKILKEKP